MASTFLEWLQEQEKKQVVVFLFLQQGSISYLFPNMTQTSTKLRLTRNCFSTEGQLIIDFHRSFLKLPLIFEN